MSPSDPVVIIGVSRRSGTNFLARLLCCHRDCAAPADPIREDHLLRDAPRLVAYAHAASRRWPHRWGDREAARAALLRHLGRGLLAFLRERTEGRRVVTKTPSPRNLSLYPHLFRDAYLVLLVRDGRSVTESLVRGFGFSYERAMREWTAGAREVVRFLQAHRTGTHGDQRVLLVRYERLLTDLAGQLHELLRFLDLPADGYDFEAARQLPVFGSSFVRTDEGDLTWEPVAPTERFDPSRRFVSWSRLRHERFEWRAGRYQRALGYGSEAGGGTVFTAVNVAADLVRPVSLVRDGAALAFRRTRGAARHWLARHRELSPG